MRLRQLSRGTLAVGAALLLSLPAQAQTSADWAAYDEVFESGAQHAQWWDAGWTGIYAASLAFDAYQASEANDPDDRFDARVGVVKSALALGGMLTDRQPHQAACRAEISSHARLMSISRFSDSFTASWGRPRACITSG